LRFVRSAVAFAFFVYTARFAPSFALRGYVCFAVPHTSHVPSFVFHVCVVFVARLFVRSLFTRFFLYVSFRLRGSACFALRHRLVYGYVRSRLRLVLRSFVSGSFALRSGLDVCFVVTYLVCGSRSLLHSCVPFRTFGLPVTGSRSVLPLFFG